MRKGKLFLSIQFQFVNTEEKIEIENHHLQNPTVMTVPLKNNQWMLKLVGEGMVRNRIFT